MPIHNWTRVPAGIFHDFHHAWIFQIKHQLNDGLLPEDYYALAEQIAGGTGPDVLTLQSFAPSNGDGPKDTSSSTATLTQPKARFTFQSEAAFYRRKKNSVVVRHVSDDRVVAVVEIVSPGNKSSRNAFRAFLDKAAQLLECKIHLLIADLFPPTKRDPNGVHAAIWQDVDEDGAFTPPAGKPLCLVSYESSLTITAFVEPVAVGDVLPDMPLILEPDGAVEVPLEATYQAAFAEVPKRWQRVLQ